MQMDNYLRMNDWEIKKFLKAVLAIQLAVWGVIALDIVGLPIPFLRQLICFFYLGYIPGIIILRILKVHKLGTVETLLYSVGLSITSLMFIGLFMNTVYPLLGISRPIAIVPLTATISVIVLILAAISYLRDRDFSAPDYISLRVLFSPPALFLYLLPLLSVLGTYLVNFHQNNIVLMSLIVVIMLIALLIGFERFVPRNMYPLAIFVIALSLCFYRSLISMFISGYDIHAEYYVANLVMTSSIWDATLLLNYNAVLSVTMLGPITCILSDISLTWVYKVIYPLWLALGILGLYCVFQKQTDDKIAFFSCFFFVSASYFYVELPIVIKQLTATLFLILLLLAMIDREMGTASRYFLLSIFGIALVVSHYGLALIYIASFIFAWLLLILTESRTGQRFKRYLYSKISRQEYDKTASNQISPISKDRSIGSTYMFLFAVFFTVLALIWYISAAGSLIFTSFVELGENIISRISATDILTPEFAPRVKEALTVDKSLVVSLLSKLRPVLNHFVELFIITGVLAVLLRPRGLQFRKEYVALAILPLGVYLACVAPPFLSPLLSKVYVGTWRLHHISLIFLAPFCVIGGITALRIASRVVRVPWTDRNMRRWFVLLPLFLVIFLLYQTGLVWQITAGHSGSLSLSQNSLREGTVSEKAKLYNAVTPEQDVFSARWLSANMKPGDRVYASYDGIRVHVLLSHGMIPTSDVIRLTRKTEKIREDAYVYLRFLNVAEGIGTEFRVSGLAGERNSYYDMSEVSHLYKEKNKIYSSGDSEIYR